MKNYPIECKGCLLLINKDEIEICSSCKDEYCLDCIMDCKCDNKICPWCKTWCLNCS